MARRIDTGILAYEEGGRLHEPLYLGKGDKSGDDYLGRVAKYIPAEIVGLYLATSGAVPLGADGHERCSALWTVFAINFALVPFYFLFATTRNRKPPLWPQIILASLAFPVWVFAIGGPFRCLGWYQGWIASIVLAFVTVVFGFINPRPGS